MSDYNAVFDLWSNTSGMGMRSLDDSYEGIENFLHRNPETCFVAESSGQIIGSILCGNDGRRGFIYHTAVDEKYRKMGVGGSLLNAVVDELKIIGINKAALVVKSDNKIGNDFWEKQGFITRDDLIYRNLTINTENI